MKRFTKVKDIVVSECGKKEAPVAAAGRRLTRRQRLFTARSTCYPAADAILPSNTGTRTRRLALVSMAKSVRRTTVDPSISSFNFTTGSDDRIRSLQLLQQQAADNSDEEDHQVRHGTTAQLDDMIADFAADHSDVSALLRARSTVHYSRGQHELALNDAVESLTKDHSCAGLFCKGRALAGLTKYGPAERAFREAQMTADDSLKTLIERELRHLRYNALKSMELKDNNGQEWTNPIEAFRISRREHSLTVAINCYNRLTEPKTRNWDEAKTKLNWNQPVAQPPAVSPQLHDAPVAVQDDFLSPVPIAVTVAKKMVSPPPGFSTGVISAPANAHGPIQRPMPSVAAPVTAPSANADAPKTAAQLLASNNVEWQTAGTKIRVKKADTAVDLPTNVFGCEGVWVGGISPKCTQSELLELFKRYGPIKTFNIGNSKDAKYMFISYDAPVPPAKAVKEMNGAFIKKITVTQENPLIVRFQPSQTQRPVFDTWSLEKTRETAHTKGECFLWRTKEGCHMSDCPYAHHDRNRGVDSCSWLTAYWHKTKK